MGRQTSTWKAHERATATALGGQRVGNTGRSTADVLSDWAAIECKARATVPQWLKDAVGQAEAAATAYTSPRLPLVVLHEVGGRRAEDLVIVPMSAFRAWFGGWRGESEGVD